MEIDNPQKRMSTDELLKYPRCVDEHGEGYWTLAYSPEQIREIRRRLDRLTKIDAALRLAQYYMRLPYEPMAIDHEKYTAALKIVNDALEGR